MTLRDAVRARSDKKVQGFEKLGSKTTLDNIMFKHWHRYNLRPQAPTG